MKVSERHTEMIFQAEPQDDVTSPRAGASNHATHAPITSQIGISPKFLLGKLFFELNLEIVLQKQKAYALSENILKTRGQKKRFYLGCSKFIVFT